MAGRRKASGLPGAAKVGLNFGGDVRAGVSTRPRCAACWLRGFGETAALMAAGAACLRRFKAVYRSGMEARAGGAVPLRCRAGICALDKPSGGGGRRWRHPAASRCRQGGGLSPHTTAEPASSGARCPVLLVLLRRRAAPVSLAPLVPGRVNKPNANTRTLRPYKCLAVSSLPPGLRHSFPRNTGGNDDTARAWLAPISTHLTFFHAQLNISCKMHLKKQSCMFNNKLAAL